VAWVNIRHFKSGMINSIEYALRMAIEGVPCHSSCGTLDPKEIASVWDSVQKLHNYKGVNKFVVIKQSFSVEDGQKASLERFKDIGKETAERLFPYHHFIVGQHTDTNNIHNHIVLNIVNTETGKQIPNKFKNYHNLKDISNEITKENGLSVIQEKEKKRVDKEKYDLEKQRKKVGRYAYVKDLKQKADLAKELSLDFKEYSSLLGAFDIKIRVEKDNISYLYPDKKRPIRGEKIGDSYERKNLAKEFIKNEEKFRKNPDLRKSILGETNKIKDSKDYVLSIKEQGEFKKSVENFTSKARRKEKYMSPSEKDLGRINFPVREIEQAKSKSILNYAKENKIGLVKDDNGRSVLKGREHVVVQNYSWYNTINKTTGNIIDFVAINENVSFTKAISKINNNPRIALLENHFHIKKMEYKSFHVPKDRKMNKTNALEQVARLFKDKGWSMDSISPLMKRNQLQVDKKGSIRLFGENEDQGTFKFYQDQNKKWQKQNLGDFNNHFLKNFGKSKKGTVFLDPFDFLSQAKKKDFSKAEKSQSLLVLMDMKPEVIDHFLAENKHVTELNVHFPNGRPTTNRQVDFLSALRTRYKDLDLSISVSSDFDRSEGREISMGL
jgi:hypothetical protein